MKKTTKQNLTSKARIFGKVYKIEIIYRRIKLPKLTREEEKINIILPNKYKKIDSSTMVEILIKKMYDVIAQKELENIMEKVRLTLRFAPEDYKVTRIDKTLGKCYADKIIINPDIVMYKKEVIEYILFYEFCQLKFRKHSKRFYHMLQSYIPNYEEFAYEVAGMQY